MPSIGCIVQARAALLPPYPMQHFQADAARTDALMPTAQAMLHDPTRSALVDAAAALDLAERRLQPLQMCTALAQMARCYRALQALRPAESCFDKALAWAQLLGAPDQAVEILCQLAETSCALAELQAQGRQPRQAALERTRDRAFEAVALAAQASDPQWEVKVLLRVSDVLDRCGDHDDAVELQARAMRLMYGPLLGG
jgi:tetratricopeptide (TPR) repeat protein